jgi:thiamine-phosphate diphosphorylase
LLVDPFVGDDACFDRVDAAIQGGVDAVHLRSPAASARALYAAGLRLNDLCADRADLIVNDRIDVAMALGAAGVQLGARSLTATDARRVAQSLEIGVSIHGFDPATPVPPEADWLLVGTIFPSASHPGEPGVGLETIRKWRSRTERSIVAIGGVTGATVPGVIAAGADGVAVISAILASDDPFAASRALRAIIDACLKARVRED